MWYRFLNNEKYKEKSLIFNTTKKFIVCKDTENGKFFAAFDDYTSFVTIENYPKKECSYFEVLIPSIHPEFKIFFDIDSKVEITETVIHQFIKHLRRKIKSATDTDNFVDISVYDSSFEDKFSFHIVVNGIKVNDMKLLKEFCKDVKTTFKDYNFSESIDMSVYKSVQQLRLLYSKKIGSSNKRTKRVFGNSFDSPFVESDFKKSLLTTVSETDVLFDEYEYYEEKKTKTQSKSIDCSELTNIPEGEFIENFLLNQEDSAFEIRDIKELVVDDTTTNYLIVLKRLDESYCKMCERFHEHENPFIMVFEEQVKFYCRRGEGKVILVRNKIEIENKKYKKIQKETIL